MQEWFSSLDIRFNNPRPVGTGNHVRNHLQPKKGQDFTKVGTMLSYGCWCQIRNTEAEGIVAGRGAPVDALDAACKAWHQCRACTTADFSTDGATIGASLPNKVSANYKVGFDSITNRIDCQFNSNDCSVSGNEITIRS